MLCQLSYASRLPEKPCGGIAFTRFEQTGITCLLKKNIAQEGGGFKTRRLRGPGLEVEGQAGAEAALLLGEDHQRAVAQ